MTVHEFQEHIQDFMRHMRTAKQMSTHTMLAYQRDLSQIVRYWERIPAAESTHLVLRQIIERYFTSLNTQKLTKSSIARKVSCVQTFATFLKSKGIDLPIALKRPTFENNMPKPLSIDDIDHLLADIETCATGAPARDRAILALLYETGMRCSELVKVRIADLDMLTRTVHIVGRGKRTRTIQCEERSFSNIQTYIETERTARNTEQPTLFLNHTGEPLTCRSIQRIIAALRTILPNGPQITPRTLRLSRAQHLLSSGTDLHVVQDFLGHNTRASTERYTLTLPKKQPFTTEVGSQFKHTPKPRPEDAA